MRTIQWINTLIFIGFFAALTAHAADQTATPKVADTKLEKIADTPATGKGEMKDCPMHQGKKECPHHKDIKHHGKLHEKCDHDHRS